MLPKDGTYLKEAYQQDFRQMVEDIPIIQNFSSNVLEFDSLKNDQVTRNVGNLCIFKCSFCSESVYTYSYLAWHKKAKHNMKTAPHKLVEIIEARYHKCCVCDKVILCDKTVIAKHVYNCCKFSLSQYIREHVVKNGHRAIPTFQDYKRSFERNFNEVEKANDEDNNHDRGLIVPSMLSSESEDSDEC